MCSKFISIELFVLVIKSFLVDIIALHVMHEFVFHNALHPLYCTCLSAQHWLRSTEPHRHAVPSPPASFSNSSMRRKAVSDWIMPPSENVVIFFLAHL